MNTYKNILIYCHFLFLNYFIFQLSVFSSEMEFSKDIHDNYSNHTSLDVNEMIQTESIWFGLDETVSLASRQETKIKNAPGVINVITADEIKNLGFRTTYEVLRTIPGFTFIKGANFGNMEPYVRGILANNKILVMIDGHIINEPITGAAFSNFYEDFPLENIKKIEIIRGPGSAMYGENAFLSVINIITYGADDIDGIKISSGYGSYDTKDESILYGKTFGDVSISGFIHYTSTDGYDGTIESDSQTIADNNISSYGFPAVSLAPGEVEDWKREFDMDFKFDYKDLYLRGFYSNRNRGPYIGPLLALNEQTELESNYVFVEVGYKKTFEDIVTIKPRVYYDQFDNASLNEFLPDGATTVFDYDNDGIADFSETYPEGYLIESENTMRVAGAELLIDYKIFENNLLTLGSSYRLNNLTNIHYKSNVDPVTFEGFDTLIDLSDSHPLFPKATRNIYSVFLQDIWDISDTLQVTLGGRYDYYTDSEDEFSPRTSLVWNFSDKGSLKMLYGEAFRAPDIGSMIANPNDILLRGNKDLKAEIIDSYEVELFYKINNYITSNITYFYNYIDDLITIGSTVEDGIDILTFKNEDNARVQGIEVETKIYIFRGNYVYMNYTFQDTNDDEGREIQYTEKHKGNFGVNINYPKYINTNLNMYFNGKRKRPHDDSRSDLPSYTLLNLSFIAKEFIKTMEIQGSVYNLLDKDYEDPVPSVIPEDLPRPGRTYFVGLSYKF
ncbi:MAG: TonB-dependent receptor [Candidatus Kuenenia sp.]|nr:TonB-dependent receptor [Candidatus Kuenenia hertensis]